MRVSHFSPPARDWQENLWRLLHKRCLLLQRKHQISVALCLRGERSKFSTAYPKSRQSRVRVLFHRLPGSGQSCESQRGSCGDSHSSYESIVSHHWRMAVVCSGRITDKPEVIESFVGLVATNAPASRNRLAALSSGFLPPCRLPGTNPASMSASAIMRSLI